MLVNKPYADFMEWSYNPSDRLINYDNYWYPKSMLIWDKKMTSKAFRSFTPDSIQDRESLAWKLGESRTWEILFGTGEDVDDKFGAKTWV